jgi:hypothetical protein
MSQIPAPYDRKHRFGTASSNNPSNPIQGYDLDAEFDAVEISMDQTQARLAQIQRDDGELANDSVGPDQLREDAYTEVEDAAADAAQEVIDEGIAIISGINMQAQNAANRAETAADAAEVCRDQACACAAAAEDSADEAADSATEAEEEANDAASSADLARYYYELMDDAVDALTPATYQYTVVAPGTTYQLPQPVSDEEFVDIHADGLLLPPTAYTIAGGLVTFNPALATGKLVVIKVASGLQIMPVIVEDWGFVYEDIGASEDWGAIV